MNAPLEPPSLHGQLPRLVELMRSGILRTEPNASFMKRAQRPTAFDGSYDFHSSVIAHFALSVLSRTRGDVETADWLRPRLEPQALARDSRVLVERNTERAGTWPYDEAWFTLLVTERRRNAGHEGSERELLAELQETHLSRMLAALEELTFPEGPVGPARARPFYCGFYRSWLFTWLLVRWCEPEDERMRRRLGELIEERLAPVRGDFGSDYGPHPYDFLWLPALAALVDRAQPGGSSAYELGEVPPWPDSVTIRDVHVLGRELSRAWPLAVDGGRGDEAARAVYGAHVASLLARGELWAGDFAAVSHWVPQYLFLGWWLEAGRP